MYIRHPLTQLILPHLGQSKAKKKHKEHMNYQGLDSKLVPLLASNAEK